MTNALKYLNYTKSLIAFSFLVLVACGVNEDHHHEKPDTNKSHPTDTHASDEVSSLKEAEHSDDHDTETRDAHAQDSLEIRQAESHVHGDAILALALDGNSLVAELESPLHNFVGFERLPKTDAEKEQLKMARTYLSRPAQLMNFNPSAKCKPDKAFHDVKIITDETDGDHGEDHHDDHDNNDNHDAEEHQDVILEYSFSCDAPEELSSVTVELFDYFPNLTELEVIFLGPGTQIQSIIKPGSQSLSLTK